MIFPLSSPLSPHLVVLAETGSTNTDLVGATGEPHLAVYATLSQTAGRGRLGRTWVAPPGETLAASVLVDTVAGYGVSLAPGTLAWLPLMAGVAMRSAVESVVPSGVVALKWPNDVQIDGLKVCGVLAELRTDDDGGLSVVIGSGVNLTLAADRLPTPTSTSLALHGAEGDGASLADRVLSEYLAGLRLLLDAFVAAGGDADASGLRARVVAECTSIGRRVRVELPGGDVLEGEAVSIDEAGRVVVRTSSAGDVAVSAGDVTHLRYE
ncbi:biotin--[acetyl-CoA-carboxylase] ligase [Frigoribacterium sp. 2-23]|uniref:biotin--[acetyl-CoA-carboxylase] ligase n=1 Tax=Frigoribacterium sp. 2-23 TaxID=3415006 RepID=UPI003C701158